LKKNELDSVKIKILVIVYTADRAKIVNSGKHPIIPGIITYIGINWPAGYFGKKGGILDDEIS